MIPKSKYTKSELSTLAWSY